MNEEAQLKSLRDILDKIDDEILELLNDRMKTVLKVGDVKAKSGGAIYRPEREKAIIQRLALRSKKSNGVLNKEAIKAIFLEIFAVSRNLELSEKVAFLGPLGTYTHQAAEMTFGAMSEYVAMNSINGVFSEVNASRAKFGIVPVENSSNGMVNDTLMALNEYNLKIISQNKMEIHHSFATSCEHIDDIKKIYSKDIVFGQCRNFLTEYKLDDVELIPVNSTAKAAQIALQQKDSAVICSHIAAKLYGLPVLFENIEDDMTNTTDFIVVSNFDNANSGFDNSSILVKLPQESGSLVRFLEEFNKNNINLIKIESHIIKQELIFYIQFHGHKDDPHIKEILDKYKKEIKFLGSYVREIDDI
ncbi:Chorismate mutase I / Prephenate dehydratase [hydrothermal vent metagenome]|uniref:Bifunctional chorismate mutase/prephenate dehydratase n=1 Tax=hydrothermal vent metagenome TaxID=652676 RepID=A0A3B1EA58_9ZZZZ